ncbi:MAG: Prolyl endopeptidase precursor [Candidatus Heimdallarchaeota archaeon LC_2]|nr:MAG: Prolyl endopeptidase precursor [Candidatus Heimdallarchaeota archaeon LC_2]
MVIEYPKIERSKFTEKYHGIDVPDPYRYLEDPENEVTKQFVEDNNKIVDSYIDENDTKFYVDELTEVMNNTTYGVPIKKGDRYFYTKTKPEQRQPVIFMREGLSSQEKAILDINSLSEDGTTASMVRSYSGDGKYLATSLSVHGSDWQHILIKEIDKDLQIEKLEWLTFSTISWNKENTGFYYSKYPNQEDLKVEDKRKFQKIYFHKINTSQEDDILVFDPQNKDYSAAGEVSYDGKYLFITVSESTLPENLLFFKEINSEDSITPIINNFDGSFYYVIGSIGITLYIRTSHSAPNNRIMRIDLTKPSKGNWTEVIAEKKHTLSDAHIFNNQLVLIYQEHVQHVIKNYDLNGKYIRNIDLPSQGTIYSEYGVGLAIDGQQDSDEFFYGFTSFLHPQAVLKYSFATENSVTFFESDLKIDDSQFKIDQIFYTSKDGTKIPMYIIYKNGIKLDSSNPTFLYGYGGYNISILPEFQPKIFVWVDNGGIYAIPNLRGGGEYGKMWHEQALLEKKQTVFDDFIAAGEWLIANKYTSSPKLAINGRSNGGLLAGACLVQRPDLFGAVVPQVGVLDMLRYPFLSDAGRYWTKEYGNAKEFENHFKFLIKYSPYHNVSGAKYPPVLITAAEGDDRVDPMHSKKFGAYLQYAQQSSNPILVRIETKAGHGFGKPKSKIIEDLSILFAFLKKSLKF